MSVFVYSSSMVLPSLVRGRYDLGVTPRDVFSELELSGNHLSVLDHQSPRKALKTYIGLSHNHIYSKIDAALQDLSIEPLMPLPVRKSPKTGHIFFAKTKKQSAALRILNLLEDVIDAHSPYFKVTERIDAFYSFLEKHHFMDGSGPGPEFLPRNIITEEFCEKFNALMADLKAYLNFWVFRKAEANRKMNAWRNYKSLAIHAECLLAHYGYLEVIKFDLQYEKSSWAKMSSPKDIASSSGDLEVEVIKSDFSSFMNKIRKQKWYKHHVVGYVWRLEFSALRGYFFHLSLYVRKGATHKVDFLETMELGWAKSRKGLVVPGENFYGKYKKMGIGRLDVDDVGSIKKHFTYLEYLASSTIFLRVNVDAKFDVIGRSDCFLPEGKKYKSSNAIAFMRRKPATEITPDEWDKFQMLLAIESARNARVDGAYQDKTSRAIERNKKNARGKIMRSPLYAGKSSLTWEAKGAAPRGADAGAVAASEADLEALAGKINFSVHATKK